MMFIGDVHGHIKEYLAKLGPEPSLQVGDMGIGFPGITLPPLPKRHRFLRGNHDDPGKVRGHKNYAGDYGWWGEYDLFFISGAFSIDYQNRVPGVSWWPEEQLSPAMWERAVSLYLQHKPKIMVTHDCPLAVFHYLYRRMGMGTAENMVPDATKSALQAFFHFHKPAIWIFGHHHTNEDFEYEGTRFICLDELSTITL